MDDNRTLPRRPSPSEIIRQTKERTALPVTPEVETYESPPVDEPERFDPDSREYKAFCRASNKSVTAVRFILKNLSEIGCSYGHLDTHYPEGCEFIPSAPGKGNVIRLRFAGASVSFRVTIEGRNLRRLWELLMGHLTPWVHEYPADFDTLAVEATVVTSITFKPEK